MDIFWHGQSCFEIRIPSNQAEKKIVFIDPFSETIGLKLPSLTANILLTSHNGKSQKDFKTIKGAPFLIDGPGEYEIGGVFIQGISSLYDSSLGKKSKQTTIYNIEAEGMRLCHLSDLNQKELDSKQLEIIGQVDILMVPVGGEEVMDSRTAQKIVNQIEPKIIIPMCYKLPKLKTDFEGVDVFLKTMGQEGIEPQASLKIKKQGLPTETKIVVLKA
ncbi:MAG: MBL fold metallo-hydrolase [Patescibacteria group bacterium]|nr:MBL fold metallo-hydrolase [Patescibacteria group bacterium]